MTAHQANIFNQTTYSDKLGNRFMVTLIVGEWGGLGNRYLGSTEVELENLATKACREMTVEKMAELVTQGRLKRTFED